MDRLTAIRNLNDMLLAEMPEYRPQAEDFPLDDAAQRRLLRSLMNVRPPMPLRRDFLALQDALLSEEREARGAVEADSLPVTAGNPRLALWRGDITRLRADAVVDADNSALLGCFCPCHGCVDNAIHSAAGLQLRDECGRIMRAQGHPEPAGQAKLTGGYNLPARYVLHTVGPVVRGRVTRRDGEELASCYRSCLRLAAEHGLETVAFCCISTGEFHFPNQEAAEIAVETVTEFLRGDSVIRKVIFNVFTDTDEAVYRRALGPDRPPESGA
ncbi:MAG: protein-ADP-ribose hydrolase [Oscillibacter sp.]|nr:protein-ADP-ribose hydrolase [Oscillibacter sp.]